MASELHALSGYEFFVRTCPDAVAIEDDQRCVSFAELDACVERALAGLSKAGLSSKDRVAVIAKNRLEVVILLLASLKGGPVCVPVNRKVSISEMSWIIGNAEAMAVCADAECAHALSAELSDQIPERLRFCFDAQQIGWQDFWGWLDEQRPLSKPSGRDQAQDYLQIYTSGTSGRPKGVVLTPSNALGQLTAILLTMDVDFAPGDTLYEALPLFHVGGVFVSLWALNRGLHLVYRQEFTPQHAEDLLASGRINHAVMVPAMIQACLSATTPKAGGYPGLKTLLYGASPITHSVLSKAAQRFACDFAQIYGMTESHSVISAMTCADHRRLLEGGQTHLGASAGRAVAGTTLSICDALGRELDAGEVGEIRVSSQHVMRGYWNNTDATAEAIRDGQLCTGDAGYVDHEGYLYIVDRLKDIIVSGGENVSSLEVESVVIRHPAIVDVAVIGTPSDEWGEAVTALIVVADEPVECGELREFCRPHLGAFKIPSRVELVDQIPRNAGGKILKARLRDAYWQGQGRHVG